MVPARLRCRLCGCLALLALCGCEGGPWNSPYPAADARANTYYAAFAERPKHLDPARSYSNVESPFVAQIYEPPLQYDFLTRPYRLVPLTATEVPRPAYVDAAGRPLPDSAPTQDIAYSIYEIRIRPGILYQPHPALARGPDGQLLYHALTPGVLAGVHTLADFPETGTRELVAADYVHQIKRLASPALSSPILGLMSDYIVGLREYAERLREAQAALRAAGKPDRLDLEQYPLSGAQVVDAHRFRIKIRGRYPQFRYWLAMSFFAPMPPEADGFYEQPGMAERNIIADWYPLGTGPYMLVENNPNRRLVMVRNPNFRGEPYPSEGMPGDAEAGLLADAGRPMPFIEKAVYSLEQESIPRWTKFLQGYYDSSAIGSDSFDQAIRFGGAGEAELTPQLQAKGIELRSAVSLTTYYLGFNMLDPVVGGLEERRCKLRQAISIAVDFEERISIFLNGRGIAAQGPLPPGLFGHRDGPAGINPYVYVWKDGRPRRKSLEEARRLLAEAGYSGGRDPATGGPLLLYLDAYGGGPDDKASLDWWHKQLRKLGIQLVVRSTDYNRFQDKVRDGSVQLFNWGWGADYPDPENFLFLLYGPNAKVGGGGENAANYHNPDYDRLFTRMKTMDDGAARQAVIDQMLAILRHDAPWAWGYHLKELSLVHGWYRNTKPNLMASNTLKYRRLDPALRARRRAAWNQPVIWPLALGTVGLLLLTVPALLAHRRLRRATGYD